MNPIWILVIIFGSLIIIFGLFMVFFPATMIFINTQYRSPKITRKRECTLVNDPEQLKMFELGIAFAKKYEHLISDLSITNDKLTLYGQYMNFGYDKCALILQGRTESLLYSYYFAKPYVDMGYNILVVDLRAHGFSDGKYNTSGVLEHKDTVKWLELIKEKYKIVNFVIHGICTGAANALYTYNKNKNLGIKAIICDGLYAKLYYVFKKNIQSRKKPVFIYIHIVFWYIKLLTKASFYKTTPLSVINKIDIPMLLFYSHEDAYCPKKINDQLINARLGLPTEVKYVQKGVHSHLRINQTQEYDDTIIKFINEWCK